MDAQAKFVEQELVAAELISVNAANIPMRAIEWLWPDRLAYGKLGLLGGLPDMGKGLITAFMMACITTRMGYPCGEGAPGRPRPLPLRRGRHRGYHHSAIEGRRRRPYSYRDHQVRAKGGQG